MSFFQKKIPPRCEYCARAGIAPGNQVICGRRGPVESGYHCRRFKYDPLKRIPSRLLPVRKKEFKPEDFIL